MIDDADRLGGRRLRVALVIPTLDRGGAEKQLVTLATGMPRDEFDVHVYVLTRSGPLQSDLEASGVRVVHIGKRFQADATAWWRLHRRFRDWRPDVVHTWIFAANASGRFAALTAGVPAIIAGERCVDPWKKRWHHWVDKRLAARTDWIATNSTGVREFYAEHGIAPEKFRVIPNGIDGAATEPVEREIVAESFGLDLNRRWLVAIGRLWPQKRYRDLIWAAELIGTLRDDTTLVVCGDGPQREELMRHRDAVTTPLRVRFVGHRDDATDLLPHADVFWNASQYEGQSNGIMEAMRAGVPVVASDIPGNTDLVDPGRTGRLVPLGDTAAIATATRGILESEELRRSMAAAARQRILDDFSVEKMVAAYAELYRQTVQSKRPSD